MTGPLVLPPSDQHEQVAKEAGVYWRDNQEELENHWGKGVTSIVLDLCYWNTHKTPPDTRLHAITKWLHTGDELFITNTMESLPTHLRETGILPTQEEGEEDL